LCFNFRCALIFDNIVWKEFFFLSAVLVIRAGFVSRENLFFFAFFSLEGTRLRVAKAARSPPSLPFPGRRSCVLILSKICFLKLLFARELTCGSYVRFLSPAME
jgi:hypothetical protein